MKSPRVWPVFGAFVLALLAIMATSAAVFMLQSRAGGPKLGQLPLDLKTLVTGAIVTQGIFLLTVLAFARPLRAARLRLQPGPRGPAVHAAVVLGTVALAQMLDSTARLTGVFRSSTLAQFEQALAGASGLKLLLALLIIGPAAGFVEELFFRGFIQTRLAERWRPWVAVVITGFLFGLVHFDPVHSSAAFALGLWLGFASERAGSIRPAIWAHVINNSIATTAAAAGITFAGTPTEIGLGVVALLVFVACTRYVARAWPAAPRPPASAELAPADAGPPNDEPDPLRVATRTGVL